MAGASGCPEIWQIFGKTDFIDDFPQTGKVRIAAYLLMIVMVGLGGREPPTSPLSVLRPLVLYARNAGFFEGHGRLRRYPPLAVFLLLGFHIRLHDEDAAHGL